MDVKKVLSLFHNIMVNHFGFPSPEDRNFNLWGSPTIGYDSHGYFLRVEDYSIPYEMSTEHIRLPEVVESEEDILPFIDPFFVNRLRREYREQVIFNNELWEHEDLMTEQEIQQKDSSEYVQYYTRMGVPFHYL